jgi:hypothetical protein
MNSIEVLSSSYMQHKMMKKKSEDQPNIPDILLDLWALEETKTLRNKNISNILPISHYFKIIHKGNIYKDVSCDFFVCCMSVDIFDGWTPINCFITN